MADDFSSLQNLKFFHARMMAVASNSLDHRLASVFQSVSRELFLGPGPWTMVINGRHCQTPSDDPSFVYQNVLIALDKAKGINNGEPFLHASWIGLCAPKQGETVVHIGAGVGYYTAILSKLVAPTGHIHAFEIDECLAARAHENLKTFDGISIILGDATLQELPKANLIYVNAGVVAPPAEWLEALGNGGRMIFPWQAADHAGLSVIITRTDAGYAARPIAYAWFIPCIGASDPTICRQAPSVDDAWSIRSVWLTKDRQPDQSAVAVYRDLWFSNVPLNNSWSY